MTLTMNLPIHKSVLVNEVVEALNILPGKKYVDCTLGLGGHALSILERMKGNISLLGIDVDLQALKIARSRLSGYSDYIIFVNDNFANLEKICRENDFIPVDGILMDLGVSSLQLDTPERGFSFQADAELDMRFSQDQALTAMDLVNILPEKRLSELLWEFGEERKSRQIAEKIVQSRPIRSTTELTQIIQDVFGGERGKINPATKTFQALRIVVNHELENLEKALIQAIRCLNHQGRLVVISYHSLEDRAVKQFIKRESAGCICPPNIPVCVCGHEPSIKVISKKVITPAKEEIRNNPRSRSAKLRVVERL